MEYQRNFYVADHIRSFERILSHSSVFFVVHSLIQVVLISLLQVKH
jgi:hypothetical protein